MGTDIHLQVQRRNSEGNWQTVTPPVGYNDGDTWLAKSYMEAVGKLPEGVTIQDVIDGKYHDNSMDIYYIKKYHTSWYADRNYDLFAMLADVRNGRGFAGTLTGGGFNPIALPRDLPDDVENATYSEEIGEYIGGFYYGDHSFSYLTLNELLDYDWTQTARLCGVIPLSYFVMRQMEGITGPPTWSCGGISGDNVKTIEQSEAHELLTKGILTVLPTELDAARKVYGENSSRTGWIDSSAVFDPSRDIRYYVRTWWTETYAECAGSFYTRVIPALQQLDPNPENVRLVFGFDS